jgi:hypothetical protein
LVARAAAEITLDCLFDCGFGWIRFFVEESRTHYEETRCAESTLASAMVGEALLDWMKMVTVC